MKALSTRALLKIPLREPVGESLSARASPGGSRVSCKARPREPVRESPIRESLSARAPPGESRVGRGWVAGEREPLCESPSARAPPGGSRVGRRGARTRTTRTTFPHCTAPYQRAQGFLTPFGHPLTLTILYYTILYYTTLYYTTLYYTILYYNIL